MLVVNEREWNIAKRKARNQLILFVDTMCYQKFVYPVLNANFYIIDGRCTPVKVEWYEHERTGRILGEGYSRCST